MKKLLQSRTLQPCLVSFQVGDCSELIGPEGPADLDSWCISWKADPEQAAFLRERTHFHFLVPELIQLLFLHHPNNLVSALLPTLTHTQGSHVPHTRTHTLKPTEVWWAHTHRDARIHTDKPAEVWWTHTHTHTHKHTHTHTKSRYSQSLSGQIY